ncbi:MAG: SDR family oxidoreductase [Betaproteobacteria bacterium]|nr:MAG: SDR family oxidoreductase [Betaproteobacteria bacterium]
MIAGRRRVLGGFTALAGVAAAAAINAQAQTSASASAAATAAADKPLKGKAAIVTGARNNQGRAYAAALAAMGADVLVHYHRAETKDQAEETARMVRANGAKAVLVQGDLADLPNVKMVFDAAQSNFGRIDVLVNTVGFIVKKPMAEITETDYERSHRANTKAMLFCMQEAARRMGDNGRIINIGTSLTAGSAPGYSLYAGTKASGEEFVRMLSKEIGKRGITVNNIAPGPLDNPFFHQAETPQSAAFAANLSVSGRLGKESDITPVVAFLAGPQSQWVNGQTLFVNGGYLTR